MAERQEDERLQKLRNDGVKLYSISKLNTMNQCEYQAYLNYVQHIKGKNIGIYGKLGGKVHDTIEECILGKSTPDKLKSAIQDELEDLQMCGIEFPLDRNGNSTIRDNWVNNMMRFSDEFTTPVGKFDTEELLILKIDDEHYMMGYADALKHMKSDDKSIHLIDWKTSSQFTGNHLLEAGRQLIVYKLALEELGYKVERASWVMVKYCVTSWVQKNGKVKEKVSEWRNLIKDNEKTIEKFLKDARYDSVDSDCFIHECKESNSFDPLPDVVKNKFTTKIYIRDYEITEELIEETKNYIKETINKFEEYGDNESNYNPCDCSKNSYFCNALCNYGGKSGQCKYWVDYCNTFEKKNDDDDDLF